MQLVIYKLQRKKHDLDRVLEDAPNNHKKVLISRRLLFQGKAMSFILSGAV